MLNIIIDKAPNSHFVATRRHCWRWLWRRRHQKLLKIVLCVRALAARLFRDLFNRSHATTTMVTAAKKSFASNVGGGSGGNINFKYKVAVLYITYILCGQFVTDARYTSKTSAEIDQDQEVCGVLHSNHEFDDPNISEIDEFPWVVAINYRQRGGKKARVHSFRCLGSLISDMHVLTSASCVDVDWWLLTIDSVRVGKYNVASTGLKCVNNLSGNECTASMLDLPVEKILIYDTYDSITLMDNVAIIKLLSNVTFTDYLRPICWRGLKDTHHVDNNLKYNYTYWTSGFSMEDKSLVIKKPDRWEISDEECEIRLAHYFEVETYNMTSHTMCTRDAMSSSSKCIMDAGSPLFYRSSTDAKWYQRGISSFNTNCSDNNAVTMYARLEDYEDWIADTVANL